MSTYATFFSRSFTVNNLSKKTFPLVTLDARTSKNGNKIDYRALSENLDLANLFKIAHEESGDAQWKQYTNTLISHFTTFFDSSWKAFVELYNLNAIKYVNYYYPLVSFSPRINSINITYYYLVEYINGTKEFTYLTELPDELRDGQEIDKYLDNSLNAVAHAFFAGGDCYKYGSDDYDDAKPPQKILYRNFIHQLFLNTNFGIKKVSGMKNSFISPGVLQPATTTFCRGIINKDIVTGEIGSKNTWFAIDTKILGNQSKFNYSKYRNLAYELLPKFSTIRFLYQRYKALLKKRAKKNHDQEYVNAEIDILKKALSNLKREYNIAFDIVIDQSLTSDAKVSLNGLDKVAGNFTGSFIGSFIDSMS